MNDVLPFVLAAGFCGLACLILALLAIIQRKLWMVFVSLGLLLASAGFGVFVVYRIAQKSMTHVNDMLQPRSGAEIYEALFQAPVNDCVHVVAQQDQIVPKLDTAIRLRMRTCPAEAARVLEQGPYTLERVGFSSTERIAIGADSINVFAPATLGDTVLFYQWDVDPGRNWRMLYFNVDSTEAILIDILD